MTDIKNHAAFIWSVADLLRGDYKQSEYGRVILPLTVLRRLDCVIAPVKGDMLAKYDTVKGTLDNYGPVLDRLTDTRHLWNTSPYDMAKLLGDPPEMETLSEIIRLLNERHGTKFDPKDRLLIQGMVEELTSRADVQASAVANDLAGFKIALSEPVEDAVLGQMDTAAEFGKQYFDTPGFKGDLLDFIAPLVWTQARVARQQHCPIGELLAAKEGDWLEYKSTFHVTDTDGTPHKGVETAAIKSVAAFLNSWDGGTLLLGVAEDEDGRGVPFGLEGDYAQFRKEGKGDEDQFLRALTDKLTNALGAAAVTNLTASVVTVDGNDICRVHVKPSGFPVEAKVVIVDKKDQHVKQTNRYVRLPNKTHKFTNDDEWEKFKTSRWPGTSEEPS